MRNTFGHRRQVLKRERERERERERKAKREREIHERKNE